MDDRRHCLDFSQHIIPLMSPTSPGFVRVPLQDQLYWITEQSRKRNLKILLAKNKSSSNIIQLWNSSNQPFSFYDGIRELPVSTWPNVDISGRDLGFSFLSVSCEADRGRPAIKTWSNRKTDSLLCDLHWPCFFKQLRFKQNLSDAEKN